MAQQRTSTPRRSLNPATRPNYTPIVWIPISVSGAAVTFLLSQDAASLVRKGVPKIFAITQAAYPTHVTWAGNTMTLLYPASVSTPETFSCALGTPQVRNQSGGYLANTQLVLGLPTPPPAGTIFSPYCSGLDLRGAVADGSGGTTDSLVSANSSSCGWVAPTATQGAWYATYVDDYHTQIGLDYLGEPYAMPGIQNWLNAHVGGVYATGVLSGHIIDLTWSYPMFTTSIIQYDPGTANITNVNGAPLFPCFQGLNS